MRRVAVMAVTLCLLLPPRAPSAATLSPELRQRLAQSRSGENVPVLLSFSDRLDLAGFHARRAAPDLIVTLRDQASRSQSRVLSFLATTTNPSGSRATRAKAVPAAS